MDYSQQNIPHCCVSSYITRIHLLEQDIQHLGKFTYSLGETTLTKAIFPLHSELNIIS